MEKQLEINKWAKTDKPNPFSYKTERPALMLSNKPRTESYSFNKETRKTYQGKKRKICGNEPIS